MAVVLDTSFLVDVARGHTGARALVQKIRDDGESALIPAIVVAEYAAGSKRPENAIKTLSQAGEIFPFTVDDAVAAAGLARHAFASGSFPGWMDALLAGFAKNHGDLVIVTRNPRHFSMGKTLTY